MLRRVVARDGRSRAFINDQPVGVGPAAPGRRLLVEVQGQHDQMGLADPATPSRPARRVRRRAGAARRRWPRRWRAWRRARRRARAARATRSPRRQREEDWLRHAVDELAALAPRGGRGGPARRRAAATAAGRAPGGGDRRGAGRDRPARPAQRRARRAALRAAARALQRLLPPSAGRPRRAGAWRRSTAPRRRWPRPRPLLSRLASEAEADPRLLEQAEERLFALRAAARKHGVRGGRAAGPAGRAAGRGWRRWTPAPPRSPRSRRRPRHARARASRPRRARSPKRAPPPPRKLERAVAKELPPLRLDKARFVVEVAALDAERWGAQRRRCRALPDRHQPRPGARRRWSASPRAASCRG